MGHGKINIYWTGHGNGHPKIDIAPNVGIALKLTTRSLNSRSLYNLKQVMLQSIRK